MALPVGVTTATITFGVPVSFTGGAVRSTVSIVPSASLVHTATGTPLVNFIEDVITSEGVSGQFTLPHTDQLGFQDESGNSYQNWYYTATISYSAGKTTLPPRTKTFQLPTGQTTVDLDLLPAGAPVLPWTAATANVTSFHGRIGAVTVQESDLPTRLSDTSLDATYADKNNVATAFRADKYVPVGVDPATTDVSAYVQQVIDEAAATGAEATVHWPAGTVKAEITIPSSVHIKGSSHGRSVIKAVAGSTRKGVVTMSQAGGPITRFTLEDVSISGDSGNVGQWGIYAKVPPRLVSPFDSGIWYSALRNVRVTNTLGGGIWLIGGGDNSLGPMQFINFDNVSVQVTSGTAPDWDGILLSGQVGQVVFNQVESSYRGTGFGHRALWIAREMDEAKVNLSDRWGYAIAFNACTFQGAAVAIQIDRAQGIAFNGCWIEDNESGFLVGQAAKGVTFTSCVFSDSGFNGLGTGYVGKITDTASVLLVSPMILGTIETLWSQDAASLGTIDVIGSSDSASRVLVGFPKNFAATGTLAAGGSQYIGVTGAATISSITSTLENGSIIAVRALSALTLVGTGGNIRFPLGWPTTARTFPSGSRLIFSYDKAANNLTLISHTGTTQTMGAVDVVGTAGAGFLGLATQSADPSAGAGTARVFSRVNGSSKTELCVRFPTGAVIVIATEP